MKPVKRPDPPLLENYLLLLRERYLELTPAEQQTLKTRFTQIVVVGAAVVLVSAVYSFIPLLVRVFMFPAFIVGVWYLSGKSGSILRWAWGRSLKAILKRVPGAPALSYLGLILVVAFFVVGILYGAGRT